MSELPSPITGSMTPTTQGQRYSLKADDLQGRLAKVIDAELRFRERDSYPVTVENLSSLVQHMKGLLSLSAPDNACKDLQGLARSHLESQEQKLEQLQAQPGLPNLLFRQTYQQGIRLANNTFRKLDPHLPGQDPNGTPKVVRFGMDTASLFHLVGQEVVTEEPPVSVEMAPDQATSGPSATKPLSPDKESGASPSAGPQAAMRKPDKQERHQGEPTKKQSAKKKPALHPLESELMAQAWAHLERSSSFESRVKCCLKNSSSVGGGEPASSAPSALAAKPPDESQPQGVFLENVVLVDVFARVKPVDGDYRIKKDESSWSPETHTIVLWRHKEQELYLIDPSRVDFTKWITLTGVLSRACPELPKVKEYHAQHHDNGVYYSTGDRPIIGYSDPESKEEKYRDCVDVAAKIAFDLCQLQQDPNLILSSNLQESRFEETFKVFCERILENVEIRLSHPPPLIPDLKDPPALRRRQSTDYQTRNGFNQMLRGANLRLKGPQGQQKGSKGRSSDGSNTS